MQNPNSTAPALHPGRSLAVMLRTRSLDLGAAAALVGSTEFELAEVVHGDRDVTELLAALFADLTHTTPDLWITLQREFDSSRRILPALGRGAPLVTRSRR